MTKVERKVTLLFSRGVNANVLRGALKILAQGKKFEEIIHGKNLEKCPEIGEIFKEFSDKVTGHYSEENKDWRDLMVADSKEKDSQVFIVGAGSKTENIQKEENMFIREEMAPSHFSLDPHFTAVRASEGRGRAWIDLLRAVIESTSDTDFEKTTATLPESLSEEVKLIFMTEKKLRR